MHLHSDKTMPSTEAEKPHRRTGGLVRFARGQRVRQLVAALALVALATPSFALDLPRLGKSNRGGNPHQPGEGFVPPGRQTEDEHDGREARDAAREAQAINGGGRVLSVDEANGGWRVKLLKEGNVRFVFVPN